MSHPRNPSHPERICWGCTRYCSANDLFCGNEVERAPHPAELFGDDWLEWSERLPPTTLVSDPGQLKAAD